MNGSTVMPTHASFNLAGEDNSREAVLAWTTAHDSCLDMYPGCPTGLYWDGEPTQTLGFWLVQKDHSLCPEPTLLCKSRAGFLLSLLGLLLLLCKFFSCHLKIPWCHRLLVALHLCSRFHQCATGVKLSSL